MGGKHETGKVRFGKRYFNRGNKEPHRSRYCWWPVWWGVGICSCFDCEREAAFWGSRSVGGRVEIEAGASQGGVETAKGGTPGKDTPPLAKPHQGAITCG